MEFKEIGTKNLRHVWSLLCSSSVTDQTTNNMSVTNLIEQLNVKVDKEHVEGKQREGTQGYIIATQMEVVSRFMKKTPQNALAFEMKIDFIDPDNKVVAQYPATTFGLKAGVKNVRMRTLIPQLPVTRTGAYCFRVQVKESGDSDYVEVDRIPLDVNLTETK